MKYSLKQVCIPQSLHSLKSLNLKIDKATREFHTECQFVNKKRVHNLKSNSSTQLKITYKKILDANDSLLDS